jgi:hypothetical protein
MEPMRAQVLWEITSMLRTRSNDERWIHGFATRLEKSLWALSGGDVDDYIDEHKMQGRILSIASKMKNKRKREDEEDQDDPERFKCAISLCIMSDPVVAEDGETYERQEILKWFHRQGDRPRSPWTNRPMGTTILPNARLAREIREYLTTKV